MCITPATAPAGDRLPSICGCRQSASWPQNRPKTGCSIAAWPRESCPCRVSANPAPGQGTGLPGNRRATCSLNPRSRPWKENGTARFWRCFWLRPAPERARFARVEAHPAEGRTLGVRRSGGQGKEGPLGAHPAFCQGCDRRLDACGSVIGWRIVSAGAPPRISGKDPSGSSRANDLAYRHQVCVATGLVNKLAPHDIRRTWAELCQDSGGDLEPI